jgi:hypothetical protein
MVYLPLDSYDGQMTPISGLYIWLRNTRVCDQEEATDRTVVPAHQDTTIAILETKWMLGGAFV